MFIRRIGVRLRAITSTSHFFLNCSAFSHSRLWSVSLSRSSSPPRSRRCLLRGVAMPTPLCCNSSRVTLCGSQYAIQLFSAGHYVARNALRTQCQNHFCLVIHDLSGTSENTGGRNFLSLRFKRENRCHSVFNGKQIPTFIYSDVCRS